MMKKVLKSAFAQWVAGAVISGYIFFVKYTCRIKVNNADVPQKYWHNNQSIITTIWHGRLILMPCLFPRHIKVQALISGHRDGRIVSNAARWWGIHTVQGSSTKGGASAARGMVSKAKAGETLFITPDGPRGPRMHADAGVIGIARMAGVPVVPVSISCDNAKFFNSWDRFMVPKPFSTIYIHWGQAIEVDRKADDTARQALLEELVHSMNTLQKTADETAGLETVIHPASKEDKR